MHVGRIFLLLILAVLPVAGCSNKGEEEPLYLGHVAPFSKADRIVGEHTRRGMRLAIEKANEEDNRIVGRRVAVVHADSRGETNLARGEAIRLVTVNRVLAILGGEPAGADELAAALQLYSVPYVTPSPLLNPAPRDGILSLDVDPAFRGEVLARFADKVLEADKVVVLVDERPLCAAVATAFARKWRATGNNKQVQTFNYDADEDADKLVRRVREAKATVLVFAGTAREFAQARAALDNAMLKLTLVFAGTSDEWARLLADADAGHDVYGATPYSLPHLSEGGKKFLKGYRARNHEDPDYFACAGYEIVSVVVQGLRDTRGVSGTRLREELSQEREFEGLTGKLTFEKGRALRPLYVFRRGDEAKAREYKPEKK
jgi:branched-chain amino acid transport system substrate-binding protein